MITFGSIPFCGNFIVKDMSTGHVLHDSRIDGWDVPPLLTLAPVISITAKDSFIIFEVKTDLKEE